MTSSAQRGALRTVLAIDPGSEQSAYVLWNGEKVLQHEICSNLKLVVIVRHIKVGGWLTVVIEQIASYGMPVGAEVFETCVWTGRFIEAAADNAAVDRMPRREVKLHLCGQARAKDANIRQALIDRFGGKDRAIGKKASQGPLYGLKADEWQALALAITWYDLHASTEKEHAS